MSMKVVVNTIIAVSLATALMYGYTAYLLFGGI